MHGRNEETHNQVMEELRRVEHRDILQMNTTSGDTHYGHCNGLEDEEGRA